MGYWDNQGVQGTKATWANPSAPPESQRSTGGWYYNPATGRVDRWWKEGTGPRAGGGGQQQQQQQRQVQRPQERDYYREAINRFNEQKQFVMKWLERNPFVFDEMMASRAREVAEAKHLPYYTELFEDYTQPIQEKISRSVGDMNSVLGELVRRRETGEAEKKQTLEAGLERAEAGFAQRGTLLGGRAQRALARKEIEGKRSLSDFMERSRFEEQQKRLGFEREQKDWERDIGLKRKEYFGAGREYERAVGSEVRAAQQREAEKWKGKVLEVGAKQFGKDYALKPSDFTFSGAAFGPTG